MLVREKTHHIDVHMYGRGAETIVKMLKKELPKIQITPEDEDFINIEDTAFWKNTQKHETPGNALWAYRDNAGLTLAELASRTGIAKTHLSEMEREKRAITLKTAKILGQAFNCNYHRFL
jgi:DNA-binding XRE family transcriptional regulator